MILRKENLDSSSLKHIQLDTETNILTVTFQDKTLKNGKVNIGATYIYKNVTEDIYNTIINAKTNSIFENSHGKCFDRLIRKFPNEFPYTKID